MSTRLNQVGLSFRRDNVKAKGSWSTRVFGGLLGQKVGGSQPITIKLSIGLPRSGGIFLSLSLTGLPGVQLDAAVMYKRNYDCSLAL
jgi:hypothetical protein